MGRFFVMIAIVAIVAIVVAAVYFTRRRRDRQLLKVSPLLLQKKGLDRQALLELHARQQENAQLRQRLGKIAEDLERALSDTVVTLWGTEAKESVERAYGTAHSTQPKE
jgi:hypothetical protein